MNDDFNPHFAWPKTHPTILKFYDIDGGETSCPIPKPWGICEKFHEKCPYAAEGYCDLGWIQNHIIWPDFDPVCPLAYREQI